MGAVGLDTKHSSVDPFLVETTTNTGGDDFEGWHIGLRIIRAIIAC